MSDKIEAEDLQFALDAFSLVSRRPTHVRVTKSKVDQLLSEDETLSIDNLRCPYTGCVVIVVRDGDPEGYIIK